MTCLPCLLCLPSLLRLPCLPCLLLQAGAPPQDWTCPIGLTSTRKTPTRSGDLESDDALRVSSLRAKCWACAWTSSTWPRWDMAALRRGMCEQTDRSDCADDSRIAHDPPHQFCLLPLVLPSSQANSIVPPNRLHPRRRPSRRSVSLNHPAKWVGQCCDDDVFLLEALDRSRSRAIAADAGSSRCLHLLDRVIVALQHHRPLLRPRSIVEPCHHRRAVPPSPRSAVHSFGLAVCPSAWPVFAHVHSPTARPSESRDRGGCHPGRHRAASTPPSRSRALASMT